MKTLPTFVANNNLLVGAEARQAWSQQTARCGCGSCGDVDNTISGRANDMPAEWLGCDNCTGQALGRPLVYRTQSQISAKCKDLSAKVTA